MPPVSKMDDEAEIGICCGEENQEVKIVVGSTIVEPKQLNAN